MRRFHFNDFRLHFIRFFVLMIVSSIAFFTFAPQMKAHSTLLESSPAPNVVIDESPEEITLLFNEPVEQDLANLTLYDWNATPILMGQPSELGERVPLLRFDVPQQLEDGTYTVQWSVVSLDGHPVSGSFSFAVGEETKGGAKAVSNSDKSTGPLIVSRTIAQGLIVLLAGLYWFSWLSERRGYPNIQTVVTKGKVIAIIVLFLASFAALFTYALSLPPGLIDMMFKGRWDLLEQFPFILMVLAQIVILFLLLVPNMQKGWYLTVWFLLAATPTFGGHVWGTEKPILAIIPRVIHQLSMALWIGALLYVILVYIWQKRNNKNVLDEEFRPFFVNRMIGASSLVILSGVLMVFAQTSWAAVIFDWQTWSTLLLIKVILTVAMLAFALFQTLKWARTKSFSTFKQIRIEWIIGIAIIFVGVWISQIMYPIAVKSYDHTLVENDVEINVEIEKLQTGEQTLYIDMPASEVASIEKIVVNLSMPDHDMFSGPFDAEVDGSGKYVVELPFTMPGRWKMDISAHFEGGDRTEWSDEYNVVGE